MARYSYLAIVVVTTIVLYYQLYIGGAVAPSILRQYHISFKYYVGILVIGTAFGALASLGAGLADRWGRANLVVYGLGISGLLTLVGVPNANTAVWYGVMFALVSIVEGVVLVATPALVRDYSPQVSRATAMGFWTLGPVVGSLVVTEVSSHTLSHLTAWQDQYIIAGIVSLVVWAIAFAFLRELSPQLRDQLMVNMHDKVLVEARAKSLDVEAHLKNQWSRVARPNIAGSAFAVSTFLIIYYTAVAFMVIYLTTVFGFTQGKANGILNWWWGVEALALVGIGILSDRLRVRKPFMLLGGVGTMLMTVVLISTTGHTHTSDTTLVWVAVFLALFLSLAYTPWMAAFTETVERIDPALTATGLAIWGWIIRTVVCLSYLLVPIVISSATPLVTYGPEVQQAVNAVPPAVLRTVQAHQALFAQLAKYPQNAIPPALLSQAINELGGGQQAIQQLQAAAKVAPQLALLQAHGLQVQSAKRSAPHEWQHWFWICFGGQAIFVALIGLLSGRWNPRRAKEDEEQHEQALQEELSALGLTLA